MSSLDPGSTEEWDVMVTLGQQVMEKGIRALQHVKNDPVWQPMPPATKAFWTSAVPQKGVSAAQVVKEMEEHVMPYKMGNTNGAFSGWVIGGGDVMGSIADSLASLMNNNCGGGDHAGTVLEGSVIHWMKQVFQFPEDASGAITVGASEANLIALNVARNACAGHINTREEGLWGMKPMIVYASSEIHSSVTRAVFVLGIGTNHLRLIPVDSDFRMRVDLLEEAIAKDRAAGFVPMCIVGAAGTVNTGATDDLEALADVAAREKIHFHVDGAFGAMAWLDADKRASTLKGMDRADSLVTDFHKWLSVPYDAGLVLVRNAVDHRSTFTLTPEYLEHQERGLSAGSVWPSDLGIHLSRGMRSLKVWAVLRHHGIDRLGEMVSKNIAQAQQVAALVNAHPSLELTAPAHLNVVCFRAATTKEGESNQARESRLEKLNRDIVLHMHTEGVVVPSYSTLNGTYTIRAAFVNHRTEESDVHLLINETLRLIEELDPCGGMKNKTLTQE